MSWREFSQIITNMTTSLAGLYRMSEGQGRELGRMMKGIKKKMMVEMISQ